MTASALEALAAQGLAPARESQALMLAWTLQQNLSQLLKLALADNTDPDAEPKGFRQMLARAGDSRDFTGLRRKLANARSRARRAFVSILNSGRP